MDIRITTHEAARRLNYSEATIRAAIDSGALEAEKFAGAWAIKESNFATFVATLPIERRALVLVRGLADQLTKTQYRCPACECEWIDSQSFTDDCAVCGMVALAGEVNDGN